MYLIRDLRQKTVDSRAVTNVYGARITCHCSPCIHGPTRMQQVSRGVDSFRQLESCAKLRSTGLASRLRLWHKGYRVTEDDADHVGANLVNSTG